MYDHSGITTVLSNALGELSTGQSLRVHIRCAPLVDDRNDTLGSRRVRVDSLSAEMIVTNRQRRAINSRLRARCRASARQGEREQRENTGEFRAPAVIGDSRARLYKVADLTLQASLSLISTTLRLMALKI